MLAELKVSEKYWINDCFANISYKGFAWAYSQAQQPSKIRLTITNIAIVNVKNATINNTRSYLKAMLKLKLTRNKQKQQQEDNN